MDKVEQKKFDILAALDCLKRDGKNNLKKFLTEESDYFTAPASRAFHLNYEGGLAEHSWNVFDILVKKNEQYNLFYDYDTLAICGLLHDLCKVNFYKVVAEEPTEPQMKYLMGLCKGKLPVVPGPLHKDYVSKLINYYKNGGEMPEYTKGGFVIDDQLPIGHGEKSLVVILKYIDLTDDEMYAIRWHMSNWDLSEYAKYSYNQAVQKSRLVTLLITADMEATNLVEETTK